MNPSQPARPPSKPENPWLNLGINVVVPALIFSKLSDPGRLGPVYALLLGLSFPLAYGLWDLFQRRKFNFFSGLGFVSLLLTGGLGLLAVDGFWFAVKEAAVPGLIGIVVLASLKTRKPLVRALLLNENVMDVERVEREVQARGNQRQFEALLTRSSLLVAASFFLSAVLNFVLALVVLKSPAGTPEFTQELGRMTALSYPVIVLPSMLVFGFTLWTLARGLDALTGLKLEDIFRKQG